MEGNGGRRVYGKDRNVRHRYQLLQNVSDCYVNVIAITSGLSNQGARHPFIVLVVDLPIYLLVQGLWLRQHKKLCTSLGFINHCLQL